MRPVYYAMRCCEAKINPFDLTGTGQFGQEEDGALILRRIVSPHQKAKPPIVLTGYHHTEDTEPVGSIIEVVGDQTRGVKGLYRVVGVVDWRGQEPVGDVPNRLLKHYVMK